MFQVQRAEYLGELENVTLLFGDGTLGTIAPARAPGWEAGKRYEITVDAFPTASEAEDAGMRTAQALLLTAVSLNFGLRLNYHSHEPPTVYDRTVGPRDSSHGELISYYPQKTVLDEFVKALAVPLRDRRLLLSMELFVAAELESNDRARFVMAVSALEPLAAQEAFGSEVGALVDELIERVAATSTVSSDLRNSLQGRLRQLKRESVRQALKRLCAQWLPGDVAAWEQLDKAYGLRSQMLHEGRPQDLDVLLSEEISKVSDLLRRIYQRAYGYQLLRSPVAG